MHKAGRVPTPHDSAVEAYNLVPKRAPVAASTWSQVLSQTITVTHSSTIFPAFLTGCCYFCVSPLFVNIFSNIFVTVAAQAIILTAPPPADLLLLDDHMVAGIFVFIADQYFA